jgi:hypothetical protein
MGAISRSFRVRRVQIASKEVCVGFIQKRSGRYRARYRDPLGRSHSRTFTRKAAGDRSLREVEVEKQRGNWIDSRDADRNRFVPQHRFLTDDEAFEVGVVFRRAHAWRLRLISTILSWGDLRRDDAGQRRAVITTA